MALLGISILIAFFTYFCFRHPPTTWSFLRWLHKPQTVELLELEVTKKQSKADAPTPISSHENISQLKEASPSLHHDTTKDSITINSPPTIFLQEPDVPKMATKQDLDRKAMPPPSLPLPTFKKPNSKPPSPPTTPLTSADEETTPTTSPKRPSFNLSSSPESDPDDEDIEPSIPSFPAANSAQRASGPRNPPQLNHVSFSSTPNNLPTSNNLSAMRAPLQNRTVASLRTQAAGTSAGLTPPPSHSSIPTKPRKKVLLTPGHSPLDWARLTSSPTSNLRGLPKDTPYLKVPPSMLKQYNGRKGKDAWTVLKGKVYNITPYLPYHPGGEPELMKCAGRDGTRLFGEVHPWVNFQGMMRECLIGLAVEEREEKKESELEEMD